MKRIKGLLLTGLFLFACLHTSLAQSYSFVYIQGDKSVPFYVKLEGEMLPRYGKNYCIIPRLETGIIQIEVLFQQNAYPAQSFRIKVPENGNRSFLLTRKKDEFSLYDLAQGFYLPSGNGDEDDHLPQPGNAYNPVTRIPGAAAAAKPQETAAVEPARETPRFIDGIELDPTTQQQALPTEKNVAGEADREPAGTKGIANSDCPEALDGNRFSVIQAKLVQFATEESRLGYLNGQLGQCYSTLQVGKLAETLESDAARYSWLKKVYPRIVDQSRFESLSALFSSEEWRDYFMEMIR